MIPAMSLLGVMKSAAASRVRNLLLSTAVALTLAPQAMATPLEAAAGNYRSYLIDDIGQALASTRTLRECLAAKDFEGARKAWIAARGGWERSEVFTSGFVPELDQQIDAWPNASHGFHGVEAMLFGASSSDAGTETDALIAHLADLRAQLDEIDLAPQPLLNGIARLAFEVGGNKADGGESRLSGTSLNDIRSNADGIALAYRVIFADAVETADPKLATATRAAIERLQATVKVSELRVLDGDKLRADGEELIALLGMIAPKIGLSKPTLEEGSR
jgi:iron uptake system component EfeO